MDSLFSRGLFLVKICYTILEKSCPLSLFTKQHHWLLFTQHVSWYTDVSIVLCTRHPTRHGDSSHHPALWMRLGWATTIQGFPGENLSVLFSIFHRYAATVHGKHGKYCLVVLQFISPSPWRCEENINRFLSLFRKTSIHGANPKCIHMVENNESVFILGRKFYSKVCRIVKMSTNPFRWEYAGMELSLVGRNVTKATSARFPSKLLKKS